MLTDAGAVDDRQGVHALAARGWAILPAATHGSGSRCIDERLALVEAASRGRLTKKERIDAMICLASSHRVVGNVDASLRWIDTCARAAPDDAVVRLFQALAHLDRGDAVRRLGVLANALLDGVDMRCVTACRPALSRRLSQSRSRR